MSGILERAREACDQRVRHETQTRRIREASRAEEYECSSTENVYIYRNQTAVDDEIPAFALLPWLEDANLLSSAEESTRIPCLFL